MTPNSLLMLCGLLLSVPITAQTVTCKISGTITGRNSTQLLVFKPGQKMNDTKDHIRIPIVRNKFDYTLQVPVEEMYQLVFEDEFVKGSYTPILFFPYNGEIQFTLHPSEQYYLNRVEGGVLNKEYQDFLTIYNTSFKERLSALDARRQQLLQANEYDRPEYRTLVKQWQKENSLDKKQVFLNEMMEWQKTGRQHTDKGNSVKAGYDSVSKEMAMMRYQYMRDHTSLPAYFLLISDMRFGSRDRLAANTIAELYPRFARAFPDHPYTQRVGTELNGMLKIRPGEKLLDVNIPDLQGTMHSLAEAIRGKAAIIDFWGSWCGPCIAKTRAIRPYYDAYRHKGFTMVGIAREYKNEQAMKKRLAIEKWDWLQLLELDDKHNVWTKFGIADATGMMLLVNKEGIIVAVDPTPEMVSRYLEETIGANK